MADFDPALTEIDHQILGMLVVRNAQLRSVVCTIARLGIRWRKIDGARCRAWLAQVESHPFYKAGQTLFDLLEWEDFMLDGEADQAEASTIYSYVETLFRALDVQPQTAVNMPQPLPDLEAGFYLYRDVLLGLVWLATESIQPDGGR